MKTPFVMSVENAIVEAMSALDTANHELIASRDDDYASGGLGNTEYELLRQLHQASNVLNEVLEQLETLKAIDHSTLDQNAHPSVIA